MSIAVMSIIEMESELKTLAQKGCGDCFAQDCEWPDCSPRAKALKEALDKPAAQEHPISSGHPDDAGFELWWSEHMPEAVQSVAIGAWNAAQPTVRES